MLGLLAGHAEAWLSLMLRACRSLVPTMPSTACRTWLSFRPLLQSWTRLCYVLTQSSAVSGISECLVLCCQGQAT